MSTLDVKPKSGIVGTAVAVRGKGLAKGKSYDLLFGGAKVATFKATLTGSVPLGTKLTVPEVATAGSKGELGTKVQIEAVSNTKTDNRGTAEFELQASVSSEAPTAYLGDQVTVHGNGLLPNENYQITLISPGYIPYAAGLMDTDAKGSGTTLIVVPDYVGNGRFQLDLLNRREVYRALQQTPPIGILGFSYKSLTAGKPVRSSAGLNCPVRISIPFRNNSAITFLPVVYAIIYNAAGQPIRITSSGVGLKPHSTGDVIFCLATLQKGKYKIGVFAATGTGRVLSKLFTFPLVV
ncbi:MAG: hypothetical protein OK441_03865 [Thaumarchaeota archaeon]|nr:hypothetical protein [Nitrososphaerota archaeon]